MTPSKLAHLPRVLLAATVALVVSAVTAAPLPFAEAWRQLQQRNPALQAARAERERRGHEQTATRSLLQPQIDLALTQTWIDEPIVLDLDPIRSAMLKLHPSISPATVPSFATPVQNNQFFKGQVTAMWPLYTGGRIQAARRAGEAGVAESEAAWRQTENALFTELVRRYYGLQLARVVQATRVTVLAGVEEHLRQATRLEAEGFVNRAERLHADVARAEARREKQKADRLVEIAGIALAGLLADEQPPLPESPLFVITSPLESAASFVSAAAAHQPVLDAIAAKRAQAAEGVRAERGRLQPEVYWFGVKELNRGDLTVLEPDWATGVGVRLPLWDRSDRLSRVRAARAQERRASLLQDDTRRSVQTLVEKSHREVVSAQEQFESLHEALTLARENLRVRQAAFREGQATSLEVVDAQLALARVETERAAAANDFVVALAALLEASGQSSRFLSYEAAAEQKIVP
ncbi:TolC family protein [Opitutus sp. ER46]|uniref:TolC family protein n=1 Tax=Opitutus sp. ER46 TaxID=2161864 RepID=UPI001304850C|nr:TolC family protein [Opitutus sp. ER46]